MLNRTSGVCRNNSMEVFAHLGSVAIEIPFFATWQVETRLIEVHMLQTLLPNPRVYSRNSMKSDHTEQHQFITAVTQHYRHRKNTSPC